MSYANHPDICLSGLPSALIGPDNCGSAVLCLYIP